MGNKKVLRTELSQKSDELIAAIVMKFGLDDRAIHSGLFKILSSVHLTHDTPVTAMGTDHQQFIDLVNVQAVVQMKLDQVKLTGIDIGNYSLTQILGLPHAGFSGTVAVNYNNALHPPLAQYRPDTTKANKAKNQTDKHVIKQIDTLMDILGRPVINTLTGTVLNER